MRTLCGEQERTLCGTRSTSHCTTVALLRPWIPSVHRGRLFIVSKLITPGHMQAPKQQERTSLAGAWMQEAAAHRSAWHTQSVAIRLVPQMRDANKAEATLHAWVVVTHPRHRSALRAVRLRRRVCEAGPRLVTCSTDAASSTHDLPSALSSAHTTSAMPPCACNIGGAQRKRSSGGTPRAARRASSESSDAAMTSAPLTFSNSSKLLCAPTSAATRASRTPVSCSKLPTQCGLETSSIAIGNVKCGTQSRAEVHQQEWSGLVRPLSCKALQRV